MPLSRISCIFAMHFFLNGLSPTASTSSARKMSESTWTAIAKPSRENMPEE